VSIECWQTAVDVSTIDYELLVRRIAEIYEQHNLLAWLDAREVTPLARQQVGERLHDGGVCHHQVGAFLGQLPELGAESAIELGVPRRGPGGRTRMR